VLESLDDRCVEVETAILERRRAPRGRDAAARRQQVLRAVRDAVQRPAVAPGFQLFFRAVRLFQCSLARERDDGVQLAADGIQPVQRFFGERDRRDASRADVGAELTDGTEGDSHESAR
jgi:hypothetical protein